MFEDIFRVKKSKKETVKVKKSRFDMKEQYQNRMDIVARGVERALGSIGLDMEVKSNRFTDKKGDDRIEFLFNLKEKRYD